MNPVENKPDVLGGDKPTPSIIVFHLFNQVDRANTKDFQHPTHRGFVAHRNFEVE